MTRRLLLSYLTITIFVLLALEVPLGIFAAQLERNQLLEQGTSLAISLGLVVDSYVVSDDSVLDKITEENIRKRANEFAEQFEVRAIVVVDGRTIADSGRRKGDPVGYVSEVALTAVETEEQSQRWRMPSSGSEDILDVAVPLTAGRVGGGAVQVAVSAEGAVQRTRQYWLALILGGVAVLAIVALISVRLSRSLTGPLNDLSGTARKLGQGDLSARTQHPKGPEEIKLLINVFNDTASKLEQLVDSQRAFIADASHQLRTPLAALRLRLENLEAEMAPLAQEDLEGAIGEVRRLSTLVDALLMLARAERELPAPEPINVAEVAHDRIAAWEAFADERAVRLLLRSGDGDPVASATPGHLEQVLDNLIANAIEISPLGGKVRIEVGSRGDHVEVTVSDEGPGMGPEERARAFDRFWRSPEARAGRDGTGLGLAIVKQLLSNDGADIALRQARSGGLAVIIRLRSAGVAPKRVEVG
jgi:signal transduction histidine kinase